MNSNAMIKAVVENDMCIGCGMCATQCKAGAISMKMNDFGFYNANVDDLQEVDENAIKVCPFNPKPDDKVKTEDEISELFLTQANNQHNKIGRYINTYAGYSVEHRLTSSSGGIATYTLTELMRRGEVQHVISVKTGQAMEHYQYAIISTIAELGDSAKTKYYPVTLADALKDIGKLNGKVAIVGVACFIKAIRLAQYYDPVFNDKVGFIIGIICGGVKSAFFAEYLASKAGVSVKDFSKPEFRIKDHHSTASDYAYGCLDGNNNQHTIKMRDVGDMWGTGLFKANACDFCDDVTTELADLSVGDAWLEPYIQDGRGHNVLVTRSLLADDIIKSGMLDGALVIEVLAESTFLASQQGSYNHRHDGLSYRIKHGRTDEGAIPPKRFNKNLASPLLMLIQSLRMNSRRKSLDIWKKERLASVFDARMKKHLFILRLLTKLNHYLRAIRQRINRVVNF